MTTDTTRQTEATIRHHSEAGLDDIDAILTDYSDESVIFTPYGLFRGLAGARVFFEALREFFASLPPGVPTTYKLIRRDFEREYAYQVFSIEPFVPLATDTFVVRNGKIVTQTLAAHLALNAPKLSFRPPADVA